jgi:hypothetical protein
MKIDREGPDTLTGFMRKTQEKYKFSRRNDLQELSQVPRNYQNLFTEFYLLISVRDKKNSRPGSYRGRKTSYHLTLITAHK